MACRRSRTKRELVRLIRTESGVEIDTTAKKEGRGAYLCPELTCWEKALKGVALDKALRGPLSRDDRERLLAESRKILKEMTGAEGQQGR